MEQTRTAVEDANAGVVNPPAKKTAQAKLQYVAPIRTGRDTQLDTATESFGQAMGNALSQRLQGATENINEQRVLDAAIRQGTDHGINQVDTVKKRTGWEKGVFGENIEYRAAQQRAVTNSINAEYLQQATELDTYASETPDVYASRLQGGLDKALAPYEGDDGTRKLVTSAWATMSAKLSAKQYEAHYAWNQLQQKETFKSQLRGMVDTLQVDATKVSTPEEAEGVQALSKMLFSDAVLPEGMDKTAGRLAINEVLNESLADDNIGMYNAAKASGWLTSFNGKERAALDTAIAKYDTGYKQTLLNMTETTHLAALNVKSEDAAIAEYQKLHEGLQAMVQRSSGTDVAEAAITRAHLSEKRATTKLAKAALKAEEELKETNILVDAMTTEDPIIRAGMITTVNPTTSKLEDALDVVVINDITRLLGKKEPVTQLEATKQILENPEGVAKVVASRLQGQEVTSPLVKRAVETFINGSMGLTNNEGTIDERGTVALASIAMFEQNEDTFKTMIGQDNYDRLQIVKRGISLKMTSSMLQKELDEFGVNKGKRDIYATQWGLVGKETRRDRIESLIQEFTDQTPTASSLGHYMEEYDRALVIYKGDQRQAKEYLRVSALNAAINYRGRVITNGKHLNDITKFNFQQLLDGAQKSIGNSPSLLTPFLARLGYDLKDKEGKTLTSIEQARGLTISTVEGVDGFVIDAVDAQQPITIPHSEMRRWAKKIEESNNFEKLRKESNKSAIKETIRKMLTSILSR